MLECSRQAIDRARKEKTEDAIRDAEKAISDELARLQFAGLICILMDYFRTPVRLVSSAEKVIGDFAARQAAQCAQQRPGGVVAKHIAESKAEVVKVATYKEYQAAVIEQDDKGCLVINVRSLNPAWLSLASEENTGRITNADYVHLSIAHEVIGRLLDIDWRRSADELDKKIEAERRTHVYAASRFLAHVINHRTYHQDPRYYTFHNHRQHLTSLFYRAAQELDKNLEEGDYKTKIGNMIDESKRRSECNALRVCPIEWGGLQCHVKKDITSDPSPPTIPVMLESDCPYYATCVLRERN